MSGSRRDLTTRIRREILQLLLLGLIAIVAFGATRAVAARSSRLTAAEAAEWHARGQGALADGDTAAAVAAFRRAAAKNRGNRTYTLALARALEADGDAPAAEHALLMLREASPEDAEVNLELARLEAARHDVPQAMRYYRNALYAPSAAADPRMRRAVRLELIRLLLANDDRDRALGELVAAAADSANDEPSAMELGRLFLQAEDVRRAADQFSRALRLNPHNAEARELRAVASLAMERAPLQGAGR